MEQDAPLITISPGLYRLLKRRAGELNTTPEQVAEALLRLQLGGTLHIEQRPTPYGPQAYIRGTRVAVRHVAAFLLAGFSVEEIIAEGLPELPPAAVHEAIAYYYDHRQEIETELEAESPVTVHPLIREQLTPEQTYKLTGQSDS